MKINHLNWNKPMKIDRLWVNGVGTNMCYLENI